MRLVLAILSQREPVTVVCRRFGVSRQTGYKYVGRFRRWGRRGLREQSRGRKGQGWPLRWRRELLRMRQGQSSWGGKKMRWLLRQRHPRRHLPAGRTLQRWLQQAGLVRVRLHKRHALGPIVPAQVARRSNQVWTADHKGWFRTGRGQRIEPLTVRDLYSRYLLAVAPVANTSYRETRRIFARLFSRHGLPKVIRCDRGSPFCGSGPHGLTRLSLWWHRLGIRVEYVSRQRRVHNNGHEQMHQILQDEVASQPALTRAAQHRELRKWQHRYNYGRPHEALRMQTPASRYRSQPGRLPRLRSPRYPAGWLVHRVKNSGHILVHRKLLGIGRAFARLPVGLKPMAGSLHHVYFGTLLLGELDLATHHPIHLLPSTTS